MNHTFYMDSTTRVYNNLLKTYKSKYDSETASAFRDKIVEKAAAGENLPEMTVSTKDMTMDEYKQYIYDKISNLPIHPSNMQDAVSVQITDAGFLAMKEDPEYEKWVLDTLKKNFMCNDPWSSYAGKKFSIFHFGATKEEYRGESWRTGYQNGKGESLFNRQSEESFWERRAEHRKKMKKLYKEFQEKKAIAKREAQHEYFEELAAVTSLNRKLAEQGKAQQELPDIPVVYETNLLLEILNKNLGRI